MQDKDTPKGNALLSSLKWVIVVPHILKIWIKMIIVRGKEQTDHVIKEDIMVRFDSIEVNNFTINMCVAELNNMLST